MLFLGESIFMHSWAAGLSKFLEEGLAFFVAFLSLT